MARHVTEKDVERCHVRLVKAGGGVSYKFTSPARRNVPDRLDLYPGGRIVFTELKAPGKQPTRAQLREHERLRDLGFHVRVIDYI